ncbi:PREDICTED: cytochrome P450 4C1-like isoform X1 [Acromyrmex echinatior]|uniref:cytochrome P450 4C1-like isoform X1 n=1 Tax=Acromyrmex echinatior TaxID=103372 RepID=UPI000580D9C1|nr:PREDICTED: cytochrome P450 4C1-like isoform X1 [Acromyrmex echinatior]
MTLVIGRTSMRTVLLTSLLPISVVLVVLARAGDVATLEYSVEPLPASREQRPRPDTVCNYYVHYGKTGRLINLVPGPLCYPIIGSVYIIFGSREVLWKRLITLSNKYYPIFKNWLFFIPIVSIRHPDDLKTILSNPKHINKSFIYDNYKPWFGTSIFISEGTKWQSQRKILTPTFHFNIMQRFVKIFDKESKNMVKSLNNAKGAVVKDLTSFISEYTLNAICDIDGCKNYISLDTVLCICVAIL